jgi:hypothetical protein
MTLLVIAASENARDELLQREGITQPNSRDMCILLLCHTWVSSLLAGDDGDDGDDDDDAAADDDEDENKFFSLKEFVRRTLLHGILTLGSLPLVFIFFLFGLWNLRNEEVRFFNEVALTNVEFPAPGHTSDLA